MVCAVCGAERLSGASACPTCGASPDVLTFAATAADTSPDGQSRPARPDAGSGSIDHGSFTPGTMLGPRYRIVGLLGRGGMGEVYRADDLTLGLRVALKFLHGDEPTLAARLRDETRTARLVSHPNVCRVHDVGDWQGRSFVSMEYVDGEDLASLLRRIGRLPADKAVEIVRQICAGLAAAHDRGVLHRDLKPANVMLDGRGQVRLTDFGLARFADDGRTGEIAGTPGYMAPEQLVGGTLSPQTDLYAVGLLLYELVGGTPPHGSSGLIERRQHPTAPPSPLPPSVRGALDPRIIRVIDWCLEGETTRRPGSALAIAAALPGGDPLAAALAAGETPAPHVVADAVDQGGLGPGAAIACLVAFAIGLAALLAINGRNAYSTHVRFDLSPEVLAARAEEVRQRLGYEVPSADAARGFLTRPGYVGWQRSRDPRVRWERLRGLRPQLLAFWYRGSPRPMAVPVSAHFGPLTATSAEAWAPSPASIPDADGTYLELEPDGALSGLVVRSSGGLPPRPVPFDWTRLFAEARLDPAAFAPTDPPAVVPVFADARAAFVGPAPDGSGVSLRVEAAAVAGRPVYFRIVAPWTPVAPAAVESILVPAFGVLVFAIAAVGAVLARRHLQSGRSDQRGALRVAVSATLAMGLAQLLEAHHTATGREVALLTAAVSWSLFIGAIGWLVYVALEPYVRRHWPHVLIGWTRVLAGRWRDRRVGGDLLIGALLGLVGVIIDRVAPILADWHLGTHVVWRVDLDALSSGAALTAASLRGLVDASVTTIGVVFFMLLIRLVSRRTWPAALVTIALVFAFNAPDITDPLIQVPLGLLSAAVPVLLLIRYGLLAGASAVLVQNVSTFAVVSLDLSPFFGRTLLVGLLLMALPAIAGFALSMTGRSLVGRRFDLDDAVGDAARR